MRRPVDAKAQDLQRVESLRKQALLQQRPSLAALVSASRRKPARRHHVDEADIRSHNQASREAQKELRALESMGPAQILLDVVDQVADEMLDETLEVVFDDLIHSAEGVAHDAIHGVDEVAGDLADDFLDFAHLN